jgi:hypothetical protein
VIVPELQVEVTQAWEAATAVKAAHVATVLSTDTLPQEAAAAWDSAAILDKDVEDPAALVERKAWERVSRVEAGNATALACAHEDAHGLAQKVAHLEGELAEACQTQVVAEENSRGLFDTASNVERQ